MLILFNKWRSGTRDFAYLVDGKLIGGFMLSAYGEISYFRILKRHRGKGFGTKMLELLLNKAKTLKMKDLKLECYKNNIPAVRLYKGWGFKPTYKYGSGKRIMLGMKLELK